MNDFGKLFKVNIYGTSHNECFGVLIDNIPAGLKLDLDQMQKELLRRKPKSLNETARVEEDKPIIKSGLFNGYTNGTPLVIEFLNKNQHSSDYDFVLDTPRPSQADFTASKKYHGFNDYRGGGAFSGRLTAALIAAGSVARDLTHYSVASEIVSVGQLENLVELDNYLAEIANQGDSVGGIVRLTVKDLPIGLGEPYFYSVESAISQILYSIGGVKGVSFGTGFAGAKMLGSEFNDAFIDETGKTKTNHAGGINGGITNGNPLVVNVFVKPIASIYKEQETFNFKTGEIDKLQIKGRHDSSIIKRVLPVLESAIQIALADLFLINKINN